MQILSITRKTNGTNRTQSVFPINIGLAPASIIGAAPREELQVKSAFFSARYTTAPVHLSFLCDSPRLALGLVRHRP